MPCPYNGGASNYESGAANSLNAGILPPGYCFTHPCASGPLPITGNALTRSLAHPIGISVTVSTGSPEATGLGCSAWTSPVLSVVHAGIFRAFATSSIGALSGVNG